MKFERELTNDEVLVLTTFAKKQSVYVGKDVTINDILTNYIDKFLKSLLDKETLIQAKQLVGSLNKMSISDRSKKLKEMMK